MATKERMTIEKRYKYLRLMHERYWTGDKGERIRLLDEMEEVTELHRKSLIRLMRGGLESKRHRRQRGRTYGVELDDALRVISESMDQICAERLQPNLVWLAEHLAQHGEFVLNQSTAGTTGERSAFSTVRRILQRLIQDEPRLVRNPASQPHSYQQIPALTLAWDLTLPGPFRCGPFASLRWDNQRSVCLHLADGGHRHRLERAHSNPRSQLSVHARCLRSVSRSAALCSVRTAS